jgi:iron complex transport system permease protein
MTAPKVITLGRVVWTVRPRTLAVVSLEAVALVLVAALNIGIGTAHIGLGDVLKTLFGGGTARERGIVFDLRMPRTLTGIGVGAARGLSGALFQSIARNPLASPDILGITWGAGVGAVGVIVVGGTGGQVSGLASTLGVPLAGLAGGLITGVLLYALSWRRGIDGYRMVLIGIAL